MNKLYFFFFFKHPSKQLFGAALSLSANSSLSLSFSPSLQEYQFTGNTVKPSTWKLNYLPFSSFSPYNLRLPPQLSMRQCSQYNNESRVQGHNCQFKVTKASTEFWALFCSALHPTFTVLFQVLCLRKTTKTKSKQSKETSSSITTVRNRFLQVSDKLQRAAPAQKGS